MPQTIHWELDPCVLAFRWGITTSLALKIICLSGLLEFPIAIISGARSREDQARLEAEGRPTAPFDLSTHADEERDGSSRFATGVDIRPQIAAVNVVRARLGAEATFLGLRWGGGSPIDPQTGIPSDWNHLDLGPRGSA